LSKTEDRDVKRPVWRLVLVGRERIQRKGVGGRIWWKEFPLLYENGNMRPVETVLRMGEGR
jgi:hypothetical protein